MNVIKIILPISVDCDLISCLPSTSFVKVSTSNGIITEKDENNNYTEYEFRIIIV